MVEPSITQEAGPLEPSLEKLSAIEGSIGSGTRGSIQSSGGPSMSMPLNNSYQPAVSNKISINHTTISNNFKSISRPATIQSMPYQNVNQRNMSQTVSRQRTPPFNQYQSIEEDAQQERLYPDTKPSIYNNYDRAGPSQSQKYIDSSRYTASCIRSYCIKYVMFYGGFYLTAAGYSQEEIARTGQSAYYSGVSSPYGRPGMSPSAFETWGTPNATPIMGRPSLSPSAYQRMQNSQKPSVGSGQNAAYWVG